MLSVGLTGNIGCGKSTVARMLAALGAAILDADATVHELLAAGGAGAATVLAGFPEAALPHGGGVCRQRLAEIVFADTTRREALERILHPLVAEAHRRRLAELRGAGCPLAVEEVALLFEAARRRTLSEDPRERFDAIVVVTCDPEVQLERIIARDAGPRAEAEARARARMAAQMAQEEKAAAADHVIDNSGPLAETERQVAVLHSRLLSLSRSPP